MFRRSWPVPLAYLSYFALCTFLYRRIAHVTDGRAIYPLDDTYIQAAIGRNLAFYHSYGISPHVFATASSSILWPFLLAIAYKLIGLHIWIPLAWNIVLAATLLVAVDRIFLKLVPRVSSVARALLLLSVVFLSSLATITFVGMEHILQAVAFVLFVYFAGRSLERTHTLTSPTDYDGSHTDLWLVLTAALNTLSRFEGAFVVAIVCLLLLIRRRLFTSAAVAFSGALPLAIFALVSIRQGGHALPNSLLMKAVRKGAILHQFDLMGLNAPLGEYSRHEGLAELAFAAVLLLALALVPNLAIPRSVRYALGIYASAVFLHCQFARLGWLGRYEFYLIVAGIVFCGSAIASILSNPAPGHVGDRGWICAASAALLALCLVPRALHSWQDTVQYAEATYATEVQFGRFLSTYYDTASIVANDVGAISYLSHVQCLDLAALGSNEVTDLVLQNDLTRATVDQISHEHYAQIALVFKNRFYSTTAEPDVIPTDWIAVGSIDIPTFPMMRPMYFMAVDPVEVGPLRSHFIEFSQHLPPEVHVVLIPQQ